MSTESPESIVLEVNPAEKKVMELMALLQERDREIASLKGLLRTAYLNLNQQQSRLEKLSRKIKSKAGQINPGDWLSEAAVADRENPLVQMVSGELCRTASPVKRQPLNSDTQQFVSTIWERRPGWIEGAVSNIDASFLITMLELVRPDDVFEIGVASGVSSAFILAALSKINPKALLYSYDLAGVCYFDSTKPIGAAVDDMAADLKGRWRLYPGQTAFDLSPAPDRKHFYFIDANHSHPWPTIDFMALLPHLKPGDYVALHDINLPKIADGKYPYFGAQYLFDAWLGERYEPEMELPNIGVVVIPENPKLTLASLIRSLREPWNAVSPIEEKTLADCEQRIFKYLENSKEIA